MNKASDDDCVTVSLCSAFELISCVKKGWSPLDPPLSRVVFLLRFPHEIHASASAHASASDGVSHALHDRFTENRS
jgi:hypothetical protein